MEKYPEGSSCQHSVKMGRKKGQAGKQGVQEGSLPMS
jgi:hypothetical protein